MILQKIRNSRLSKVIALVIVIEMMAQTTSPMQLLALTSGPSSPEFASFEPVATTDMVDVFSGDFNYNLPVLSIPGPEGAGYAMSLSYHSGFSQESEASWVGLGWTLNPGAINRNTRGFPDDYSNAEVIRYNKTRPNWTVSSGQVLNFELKAKSEEKGGKGKKFSFISLKDMADDAAFKKLSGSLSFTSDLRFNNYKGYMRTFGVSVSASKKGFTGSIGMSVAGGMRTSWSANFSAAGWLKDKISKSIQKAKKNELSKKIDTSSPAAIIKSLGDKVKRLEMYDKRGKLNSKMKYGNGTSGGINSSQYNLFTFAGSGFSLASSTYYSNSRNGKISIQGNVTLPINFGIEVGGSSSYSINFTDPEASLDANGFMYNQNTGDKEADVSGISGGSARTGILSDYYVEKLNPYQKRKRIIGVPFNNYDIFTVSGEGVRGGFRLYHKQPGIFYPEYVENIGLISQLGFELGIGSTITVGFDFGMGWTKNQVKRWKSRGDILGIKWGGSSAATAAGEAEYAEALSDGNTPTAAAAAAAAAVAGFDHKGHSFFRFNNDLGGNVIYSSNSEAESFYLDNLNIIPGIKDVAPFKGGDFYHYNPISDVEQSTYVNYTTVGRINATVHNSNYSNATTSSWPTLDSELWSDITTDQARLNLFLGNDYIEERHPAVLRQSINKITDGANLDVGSKLIGEIATYNKTGEKYVYGLPVYTRETRRLSVAPKDIAVFNNPGDIINVHRYEGNHEVDNDVISTVNENEIIGERNPEPYASTYLLTHIEGKNYIDKTLNGCSKDDFGSWTQFQYRKKYGYSVDTDPNPDNTVFADNFYKYRAPYSGFYYSKGQLSSKNDDKLTVSSGEKEVFYLKQIETKSHIAFFVTNKTVPADFTSEEEGVDYQNMTNLQGSLAERLDGRDARDSRDIEEDNSDPEAGTYQGSDKNAIGEQTLEYLEKIILYSKNDLSKPLKEVKFEYDYSLIPNTPNNVNTVTGSQASPETGRLTLKKVWFESKGIKDLRTRPYEFEYIYKKSQEFEDVINTRYQDIAEYGDAYEGKENPEYSLKQDPWGNYAPDADNLRAKTLNPWVNQKLKTKRTQTEDPDFDPAAWHLKQIKLPSGGEIHIQYEQKDYKYVQNRPAMLMVPLRNVGGNESYNIADAKYTLDLEAVGITATDDLAKYINNYYKKISRSRQVYFKYLYALDGPDLPWGKVAAINAPYSEYIDGYVHFGNASYGSNEIEISLGDEDNDENGFDDGLSVLPRDIAREYFIFNVAGLENGHYYEEDDQKIFQRYIDHSDDPNTFPDSFDDNDGYESIRSGIMWDALISGLSISASYSKDDVCKTIKKDLSYLRIPIPFAKKGGGVRVKRLLMYDEGIETSNYDAALYGNEYSYTLEDGTSSGVATNEPAAAREENPLVDVIQGVTQSWFNKVVAGDQKADQEGPVGESILPPASVGHSRIVVSNIFKGKTGNDITVHKFHTVKDWPFDKYYSGGNDISKGPGVDYTSMQDGDYQHKDWMNLPLIVFNYKANKAWASQGFRFIKHNMHGLPLGTYTYGNGDIQALGTSIAYKEFEYYLPGEKVEVITYDKTENKFKKEQKVLGVESDIAIDMRAVHNSTFDMKLEIDVEFTYAEMFKVGFSLFPTINFEETKASTIVNSKVFNYSAILKTTKEFAHGKYVEQKNLAFDPNTGSPIVSSVTDTYADVHNTMDGDNETENSVYYDWKIPAASIYEEMGQKSQNTDYSNLLTDMTASFTSHSDIGNPLNYIDDVINDDGQTTIPYLSSIINSSVNTYSKELYVSEGESTYKNPEVSADFDLDNSNLYVLDILKNKRLPNKTYVYKEDRSYVNSNFNNGYYNSFEMFNWSEEVDATIPVNWINTSEVTKYSPSATPLEEKDILDIYSSVKYGYNNQLPIIVAGNAKYEEVYFQDYENEDENDNTVSDSHSGFFALNYSGVQNEAIIDNIKLTTNIQNEGAIVCFWLKSKYPSNSSSGEVENINSQIKLRADLIGNIPVDSISQVGEWKLYQAVIKNWGSLQTDSGLKIYLDYNLESGEDVYIDDVRFQPYKSQMNCYVYDKFDYKVLATFNDQHFGTFYQYNNKGKLIRKMIETERGLKTVEESQYNNKPL